MLQRYRRGLVAALMTIVGVPLVAFGKTSPGSIAPFNSNPLPGLIEMILGLGIVLVLAYLSIRFLGRKSTVRQRGSIELLAARQISPNKSVQVIGVEGRRYLIGVGDQVTLLADLTADGEDIGQTDAEADQGGASFGLSLAQALASARARFRQDEEEER